MIKIRSNFKLCGEEIIPKFNRLIALYSFTVISGFQFSYSSQLTVYNTQQLFSQLTDHNSFFYSHSQTKQTLSTECPMQGQVAPMPWRGIEACSSTYSTECPMQHQALIL
jgi:hypothetical protein